MEVRTLLLTLHVDNDECVDSLLEEAMRDAVETAISESDLPIMEFHINEFA